MILYNNPTLLDFLVCAHQLPPSEIAQVEALTGQPYDGDRCAANNFLQPGPKWVIKDKPAEEGGEPLCVGGYIPVRPGVWRDYMLTTPAAWAPGNWFGITRMCRAVMKAMLKSGEAHRLECIALASRTDAFKWYKVLGLHNEGTLHGYCANGADAVMFARVEH